jgi:hypothetical protein
MKIDVAKVQRDGGGFPRGAEEQEGDEGAIPALDHGPDGHVPEQPDHVARRRMRLPAGGPAGHLGLPIRGEVVGVGMAEFRAVARLVGQPFEERPDLSKRPVNRGRGELGSRRAVLPRSKIALEGTGALGMEAPEILRAEPCLVRRDRRRRLVYRRLGEPAGPRSQTR